MIEDKYYSKQAGMFTSFTLQIEHLDKTIHNRPLIIEGMRRHDLTTMKTLLENPDKVWTLQEIRTLEGW